MKSLISSSKLLFTHQKYLNTLQFFKTQNRFQFTSLKKSEPILQKLISDASKYRSTNLTNSILQNEDSVLANQQQALKIINQYITVDEIKDRSNAIQDIILKLIKVLEFNSQNTARSFYLNHKEKIDKIIYDLKSYNSQSQMSTKQILLMFYLCKLASDCGYQHRIDGFQLRATIKLQNNIKVVQNYQEDTPDTLTPSEVIYGYWLTSRIGCNNHEYKWKSYLMMLNMFTAWKKKVSQNYHASKSQSKNQIQNLDPPMSVSQISSLLQAHFMEEIHLSTEYHIVEFLIQNLHSSQSYYFNKEQFERDENLFIKTFSHLIGIEQHFINGKQFFMLQEIVAKMSQIIQSQLAQKLIYEKEIREKFQQSVALKQFLLKIQQAPPVSKLKQSQFGNTSKYGTKRLNFQEVLRYFIFLNEIRQNNSHFKNLAYDHYSKIQFLIFESLTQHFQSLIKDNQHLPIQMLSLYTRTWILRQQYHLEELQQQLQKQADPKIKAKSINSLLNQLSNQFNQLIENLATKLDQQLINISASKNKTSKKETFHQQKNKIIFLKNVQQNLIKPIIDFIHANGKSTIMNTTLISSQKLALIETLEDFLTYFFGEEQAKSWKDKNSEKVKIFTSQSPNYWMLKYARLESVHVKDNKLFIKQFQSLLEEISANVSSKTPQSYTIISVYNIYAYLCKLQQKMIQNQQKDNIQQSVQDNQIKIQRFGNKKQYQNFLNYKTYISELVFEDSLETKEKDKQNKWAQIPKKYRIQGFFNRDIEHFKDQRLMYLMKVSSMNKKTGVFNIERFFNIVFRANRYFNHQILSQQVLLHLFGTQQLINKNLLEYISNTNQRSRQNIYELIYIMLISGNKYYDINTSHTLELKNIKIKIQQSLNDKVKGNMVIQTLRQVLSPRKTSYLQKTPLKYRPKPYSIFQTVSQQTLQKKQIILQQFLDIFHSGKSHTFGWVQLVLYNIGCLGSDRSDVVSKVVLPWLSQKIRNGDIIKATVPYFVLSFLRLIRFSSLRTNPSNQKYFVDFLASSLPILYENLERNKKQYVYSPLIGYLLQIEHILKRSKINSKKLLQILKKCKDNIENTSKSSADERQSNYFMKLTQTLDRIILSIQKQKSERQDNSTQRLKLFHSTDRKNQSQTQKTQFQTQKSQSQAEQKSQKGMFGNKKTKKVQ